MSFELGDILCGGKFSNVYNLEDKHNKKKFVIKFIESKNFNNLEIFIMEKLKHQNITSLLYNEINDKGLVKIIFEKASYDLNKYIKIKKPINRIKKKFSFDIAKGIKFLHLIKLFMEI